MNTRILFVDDEPVILDGLRRLIRSQHKEWKMSFAQSGREAMELVSQQPFDAVVTDMHMPEMDGPQILEALARDFPGIVRIVLSANPEETSAMESIGSAHHYLSKPCGIEILEAALIHTLFVRQV